MILLYAVIFILAAYSVFFLAQFSNIIFHGYPPFISSSFENIDVIIRMSSPNGGETVYELGCGRARFLRMMEKLDLRLNLIGVENLFSVFIINFFRLKLQGSKVQLINRNIFNVDLSQANIIYCYLNSTTMLSLGAKIIKECRPGTKIICQVFSIPQLKPIEITQINDKKVYLYTL